MIPPTDRPRVTVLIPCLNDGELIGETLTSLLQDHDLEIVIIDDASTDQATLETLRGLEAEGLTVVWREENGGVARARADGLEASSAPYVYPLDADDVTIRARSARWPTGWTRTPARPSVSATTRSSA